MTRIASFGGDPKLAQHLSGSVGHSFHPGNMLVVVDRVNIKIVPALEFHNSLDGKQHVLDCSVINHIFKQIWSMASN